MLAEGDIAYRGQIVQVEILLPRGFQFFPRLPQLLVLHLQLDLMHLQLMKQTKGIFRRHRPMGFRRPGRIFLGDLVRPAAQIIHLS